MIKSEYYFGKKIWPVFGVLGFICAGASLFPQNTMAGAALGLIGFCCFWSIKELFEQEKRVQKGWHPRNPNRKD
ncbi:DUF4491 domain-containing protein [Eubacteriales bacterium]|nr:DUF4491 domain-containing protein [Eubacteriales bacterium]GKH62582.1 DUF4491 domain-containing protein [Eubacteriales bacterium]